MKKDSEQTLEKEAPKATVTSVTVTMHELTQSYCWEEIKLEIDLNGAEVNSVIKRAREVIKAHITKEYAGNQGNTSDDKK